MASQPNALFRALLLATSLGWNVAFARDANGTASPSSSDVILFAPRLGVSQTSLLVPITTISSSSSSPSSSSCVVVSLSTSSSYSQPPIAYSPVTGKTRVSLDVPTSSVSVTVAPYPVTQNTESSLVVPTRTSSRSSRSYRRPTTENTGTSLDVPIRTASISHPIAYSPVTGHEQTSLEVPTESTTVANIVVTAKTRSRLDVPTLIATVSLPPDTHGGYPVHQQDDARPGTDRANVGGILASLVQQHSEKWDSGDRFTAPTPAGASAATMDGTTYSLAPSGQSICINGQAATLSGPSATDSVALAVMSALGVENTRSSTSDSSGSSTLATTTSDAPSSSQESGGSSADPVQQTGNGAGLVLPGIGLGGVGVLMALL